jgi:serine phosphatase RsbU (regulator of sigma subunit)
MITLRANNIRKTSTNILCFILLLGFHSTIFSNHAIDSLRKAYNNSENAHERVLIQLDIAKAYYQIYSIDTSIFEYRKAIGIMHPDSLSLKAKTLNQLAHVYRKIEDMDNCLETHRLALNIYEEKNDYPNFARSLSVVGRDYYAQTQYDSAMTYYMEAKEVYERHDIINEDYGFLLHFIGSVFKRQGDNEAACEYYNEEIKYGRTNNFPIIEAEGLYLTGICGSGEEALEHYTKSLRIYTQEGSDRMIPLMYTLISGAYKELGKIDSSLYYQELCLKLYRENNEISHLASALSGISSILIDLGRYNEARKYLMEAEEIAKKTQIKQYIRYKDIYHAYYRLFYKQNNYKEAVKYQSMYYAYKDSVRDSDHQDAIVEMEKIYNDEKQTTMLAMQEKENELQNAENLRLKREGESETFIKYISFSAVGLVLILGIFIYLKYRQSQKQKILISNQKREMQFQKELVEEKNKDITDSMVYASSIQKAIITSEEYISEMFKEFFVFYKPRDIVSGDFYWAYETSDGKKLIAVGDCTGHGVPGAMMSMLGTAFLNEIVVEGGIHKPSDVLNKLRKQIQNALHSEDRKDGMDMSFCRIENNKLTFSGANLPLYLLRKGDLQEVKGNKQPVGFVPHEEKSFTDQEIILQPDDQIYLFSDGYADQFGGEKGKKYKYKTFRDKIRGLSGMSLKQQKKIIVDEFDNWKGDLEQLDDVCVVGVKI